MASRRRTAQNAAALPASRLPLGTPLIATPRSPPISHEVGQTGQRSPRHQPRSNSSSDKENHQDPDFNRSSVMDTATTAQNSTEVTLAEAKLQRQMTRIEQAGAALKPSAPLDRQASRARKQAWKAFDYTADPSHPGSVAEGGVAIPSEVRVNTFRPAPSRASSLNRSMSSLSQHTSTTGPSEMERQDSGLVEAGFQVYTARRARRKFDSLGAYEDKPEEKQATVEASFDKREIYEVFGNALPGPEYMEQNAGSQDGQLQFVQHPNGDVSAHQWSTVRYIWENIGQYSNIRKRVEGQLASDRLKGETAHQTLQQNTLVYFKTVAKQREASVTGVPFGSKEIQAALPNLKPVDTEPSAGASGRPALDTNVDLADSREHQPDTVDHDAQRTIRQTQLQPETAPYYGGQRFPAGHLLSMPAGPRITHPRAVVNTNAQPLRYDDPFYSQPMTTYQTIYGGLTFHPPPGLSVLPSSQSYVPHSADAERQQRPQYNTFGQLDHSSKTSAQHLNSHNTFQPRYGSVDALREQYSQPTSGAPASQQPVSASKAELPRPKPVMPLSTTRSQMLGHLKRLGHQAETRRQSQDKIRTVLYDPFRDSQPPATSAAAQAADDISPTNTRHMPPGLLQSTAHDRTPVRNPLPTIAAHAYPGLTPAAVAVSESLKDSSPDTYWDKRATNISTPYLSSSSYERPTPQNFKGPFFTADTPPPRSLAKSSGVVSDKSYDQELSDWWNSGNNFMRQEEFYQSIKAADNSTSSQPAIGTLAAQGPATSKDTGYDMTRLLVPVLENLAAYVQGPVEKRRDYFSQWSQPPEWCVDRSASGNNSFFDSEWGQPPQRLGRDPRYRPLPVEHVQFGTFTSPQTSRVVGSGVGSERRFGFGGRM